MIFRLIAVDSVDEATCERGLIEQRIVRAQEIVSLVTRCTVMVNLAFQADIGVVPIVTTFAIEIRLRYGYIERVVGQVTALQLVREVGIGVVVDDAPIGTWFVVGRQSGCRGGCGRLGGTLSAPVRSSTSSSATRPSSFTFRLLSSGSGRC